MGLTVLPSSLPARRGAAPASRACTSRLRLNPACIGSSAYAAAANPKETKRPGSRCDGEPPTKRRRVVGDAGAAEAMSLEEKNRINRLLSFLPPDGSPNEVIPLPDSIVRVFQEYGTRSRGGGDDEIEIDVHALSDDALRAIKDCVGAYLADRAGSVEARKESKEGFIQESAPRSFLSKAAPKSITPTSAPKSITQTAAPKSILLGDASESIPSKAAPKMGQSKAALKIAQSKAAHKSIPPRPKPAQKNIPPSPATNNPSLRAVPLPPAPPKPESVRESVSEHLETDISQSPLRSTLLTASRSLQAPPKKSESKKSMKELIADAGVVMKNVIRRREIEKLRAAARQEVEQIVRTVEFNDPYIDCTDVFK